MPRALTVAPFSVLATIVMLAVSWPMPAAARGKATEAKSSQDSMSVEANERYCEEEKQRAHEWMTWAAHQRNECNGMRDSPDKYAACVQQSVMRLDALEKEHAEIYINQVRNLHDSHPVMTGILHRLKSHKDLAGSILVRDDAEPETLGAQLKLSCMAAAQQPASSPRKR